MSQKLVDSVQTGFSSADKYDQYRPTYPAESVENLLKQLGVSGVKGARILDLAAGTGKFTELLARRPEQYEVLAVEPHDDMRKTLADKNISNVKTQKGYGEEISGVEDDWADAVIVAQAFHWFATLPALKEIHRVLAPGAILGLIWNIEDCTFPVRRDYIQILIVTDNSQKDYEPSTDYEAKLKAITWSMEDASQRYRNMGWQKIFDDQLKSDPLSIHSANPLFSLPLGEHVDKWEVWLKPEAVWSRYYTLSHIAMLKGEALEKTKKDVFDILDAAPKNENGEVAIHGNTFTYWSTAIPSDTLRNGG